LLSVHSLGSAAFNEQAEASYKAGLIQAQIVAKPDGLGFSLIGKENIEATKNTLRELGPVALQIEKNKQARMTEAANAQIIKGQDMSKKAMAGSLTEEEVVTAVTNGEISEQGGKALAGTIRARAQLSVFRQGIKSTDLDDKNYIKNISDYANMSNEDKDDVTHEERMAMLGFMDRDPVLSASGKAEAMKLYLDALGVDLKGWEDNGKTKRPHINGRDIGEIEARARARVYASFKSAPNLGAGWAGTAMIQAEQEITDFFTSDDYKPDAANKDASDKLVERINQRVYNLAAASWIGRLYP
jgi:tellurite resistance protein